MKVDERFNCLIKQFLPPQSGSLEEEEAGETSVNWSEATGRWSRETFHSRLLIN